jgi:hypothetical protein
VPVTIKVCARMNPGDATFIWKTAMSGKVTAFDTVSGRLHCRDRFGAGTFNGYLKQRKC